MDPGLQKGSRGSLLVVAAAVLLLACAAPLLRAYAEKLVALHGRGGLGLAAAAVAAAFGLLWAGLRTRPRAAAGAIAVLALTMTVRSGNIGAALAAALVSALVLLSGDFLFRALCGTEAGEGDLAAVFAAGLAGAGLLVLLLAEIHRLRPASLVLVAVALAIFRARRAPALARNLFGALRFPRGGAPAGLEAAWLAFAALILLAIWAAAQGPDVSWDALAYHLPEARDIAATGAVRRLADLEPQSLLWRNHDAFLALGYFAGGDRVVRFLQLAAGFAVFPATL